MEEGNSSGRKIVAVSGIGCSYQGGGGRVTGSRGGGRT